jgi:feruloyl esterase
MRGPEPKIPTAEYHEPTANYFASRYNVRRMLKRIFLGLWLALSLAARIPLAAATCESLSSLAIPHTTITLAQSVGAGEFALPAGTPAGFPGAPAPNFKDLPAFCRVAATSRPTSDSEIKIEVWMPVASTWNGEFRGTGNGGLGGNLSFPGLAAAMHGGFAAAGENTGHENGSAYALDHPEKIIDFGDRAAHEMTITAKAAIAAFYGSAPKRSYMNECGGGSIAALKEAQKYPGDYDGVVVGGFAAHLTHHTFAQMWIWQATHKDAASVIPPAKFPAIHAAALAACDAKDGVKDGVIANPPACKFDPGVIECRGPDSNTCLTAPQVEAARKLYAGPQNPRTGEQIYSPLYPGSELGWGQLTGDAPIFIATDFMKYFVLKDPNWDYKTHPINFDSDVALSDNSANQPVNAMDPDIKKFAARGGKMLLSGGWNDAGVPPLEVVNYYNNIVKTIGAKTSMSAVRLYMVPGMGHCGGGEGTDHFDLFPALQQWVERKQAPGDLIASRIEDGKEVRTRPLCAYPEIATYKGSGSTDDAANFACNKP